jgi:hypothetical protein
MMIARSLCILVPAHLRVCCCKKRLDDHRVAASGSTREGGGHRPRRRRCSGRGNNTPSIDYSPLAGGRGQSGALFRATAKPPSLCPPHQNVSSPMVTVDIARIDFERAVDPPQREIITPLVHVDKCKRAVGVRRHRIECPGLLRERFGLFELFLPKFGPSPNDGFEMRAAEGGIARRSSGPARSHAGRARPPHRSCRGLHATGTRDRAEGIRRPRGFQSAS